MRKFILFTLLICFSASVVVAQKNKTPVKKIESKTVQPLEITEISEADWKILIDALQTENWNESAALAARYLKNFKTDNDKKQLARLRYFYLYSLAGQILTAYTTKEQLETDLMWSELNAAIGDFTGKEFVLPPRRFLPECKEVVNYICPIKNNERALRVTATNRDGTAIHSFDYVSFEEKISTDKFGGGEIFLGGKLKRAEFNQDMSKPWVMRLIFEKGFVRVVVADDK